MTDDLLNGFRGPRTIEESEWRVMYSLRSYQLIESILKAFLCMPTKDESSQEIAPKYTVAEVKDLPLGKLIKRFKNICNDTELLGLLSEIVSDRNMMAHQALITQNEILAEMIGADVLALEMLRKIDRRATKAMTTMVCAYIRSQSGTARHSKDR